MRFAAHNAERGRLRVLDESMSAGGDVVGASRVSDDCARVLATGTVDRDAASSAE